MPAWQAQMACSAVEVVGCGDGDGVDTLVFEDLAHVGETGRSLTAELLHRVLAQGQEPAVHVADRGDFHVLHLRVALQMNTALAVDSDIGISHSDAGDADRIVGAGPALRRGGQRGGPHQEVSAIHARSR